MSVMPQAAHLNVMLTEVGECHRLHKVVGMADNFVESKRGTKP